MSKDHGSSSLHQQLGAQVSQYSKLGESWVEPEIAIVEPELQTSDKSKGCIKFELWLYWASICYGDVLANLHTSYSFLFPIRVRERANNFPSHNLYDRVQWRALTQNPLNNLNKGWIIYPLPFATLILQFLLQKCYQVHVSSKFQ